MPYTRANDYVDGEPIVAEEIRVNHQNLRAFVNRKIVTDDLATRIVDWISILAGEYFAVIPAHRFTTGNLYSHFVDSEPSHQTAIGASMKTVGPDTALYHPICGQEVRANVDSCHALAVWYLDIEPRLNDVNATTEGLADDAFLFVDGVLVKGTVIEFYAPDTGSSAAEGSQSSRYRVGTCHHLIQGLSKGLHQVEIRINPRHDLTRVFARAFHVECFEV